MIAGPLALCSATLHASSSSPTPSVVYANAALASPRPTDYTPLMYGIYVLLAVVSIVAFVTTLRVTRSMTNVHLKLLLRVLPISVCWSFAPCGAVGYWWPAPCAVVFGFSLQQKLVGLGMMVAATVALYLLCALVRITGRLAS